MEKMINIIVFVLTFLSVQGQAYDMLLKFRPHFYDPFDYEYTPCPWQTFRTIPHLSIQIDLIATRQEAEVLSKEPWLFSIDLLDIYRGYPFSFDRLELIRRWSEKPKQYRVQIPGLVAPYDRHYDIVRSSNAVDITKNGYNGWYYEIHKNGIGIAIKELAPDKYQVSGAMFLITKN